MTLRVHWGLPADREAAPIGSLRLPASGSNRSRRDRSFSRTAGRRCGYTLLEVASTVLVTMVLTSFSVEMLARFGQARREVDRYALAIQEVANLMERVSVDPALAPTAEPKVLVLSDVAKARLPDAVATLRVADDSATRSRRATVELIWRTRSGTISRPIRLSAWFPTGGRP